MVSFDRLTNSIFGTSAKSGGSMQPDAKYPMDNSTSENDQLQSTTRADLMDRVLAVTPGVFDVLALDIYRYQYRYNPLYRQFCDLIGRVPDFISVAGQIPHLPIALFKSNSVQTGTFRPEAIFESSTTTGQIPSRHLVGSLEFYNKVSELGFRSVIGKAVSEFMWYGLLPSYLDRPNASLVHMVRHFMSLGGGGFFLNDYDELISQIRNTENNRDIILIGVTFALLDLAEQYTGKLPVSYIIETGGMKGRRQEVTRQVVHETLGSAFGKSSIGSEYGMTELLSQAWSTGNGLFECTPTLKVRARDLSDPLMNVDAGTRGALNITDIANIDSCSFIATDDAGIVFEDGTFEVQGRLDGSEQRGCNLMFAG